MPIDWEQHSVATIAATVAALSTLTASTLPPAPSHNRSTIRLRYAPKKLDRLVSAPAGTR